MNDTPEWVWVDAPDLRPGMQIVHDDIPDGWQFVSTLGRTEDGGTIIAGWQWTLTLPEDDRVQSLRKAIQVDRADLPESSDPDDIDTFLHEMITEVELVQSLLLGERPANAQAQRIRTVLAVIRYALGHPPSFDEPEPDDYDLYPTPPKAD